MWGRPLNQVAMGFIAPRCMMAMEEEQVARAIRYGLLQGKVRKVEENPWENDGKTWEIVEKTWKNVGKLGNNHGKTMEKGW